MKKILGVVVIVAALVLGSYYGMGVITERTLKKNLAMVNQSNGLVVNIENYNRGWFKSTALLNWRLHIPARIVTDQNGQSTTVVAKDFDVQMPLNIYHGPFIVADKRVQFGLGYATTDVVLPPTYAAQLDNLYTAESTKPMLNLSVFVTYLNNSRLHLNVPAFKLIAKEGNSQFEWLGMTSDVSISSRMQQVDGRLAITGMRFNKDKIKAVVGNVDSDYNLHQTETGLYLGDANIFVPTLLVTQDDQPMFEVDKFDVKTSSDVKKGLFASHFKVSFDKMVASGKVYGASSLSMAIENIDAQVLAQMNEQLSKIQQGSDTDRQRALFSLLPELPNLLNKGAAFEVSELSITMPEGVIKGNVLISLPNEKADNPFQLIQKIHGQGKLTITAALFKELVSTSLKQKLQSSLLVQQSVVQPVGVEQAAKPAQDIDQQVLIQTNEKLAALVKSGLLAVNGADYVLELSLAKGQLVVNGKPFNPAMMQF